jgi:flagellin
MALNSINTNIGAYYAQSNIGKASNMASSAIARLSSGNRIVRAADDVAAMSAGTSLRTNVTTLRMALINTSQGSSLLQVADGALSQVTDILQRQKAIAVQAGSGSLTSAERSFLNQEFKNLTQEIDRLAGQTNFNGVNLLDGLLTKTVATTATSTAAASGKASLSFSTNAATGQTLVLNGQTITIADAPAAGQVQRGATTEETLDNLVTFLNSSTNTALSVATYSRNGLALEISSKGGGTLAQSGFIVSGAGTWTTTLNAAALNGPDSGSFIKVFAVDLGSVDANTNAVAATATAAIPFKNGTVLTAKIGGGAATVLATFDTGQSLNSIINEINTNTGTHGFTAHLIGRSGSYNIVLSHANPDMDNGGTANDGGDITITNPANAVNNAGAATAVTAAANTIHVQQTGLGSGGTTGLGWGDTVGIGVIGNNVLTAQTQTKSQIAVIFPEISDTALTSTLVGTAGTPMQIRIGDPAAGTNEYVEFAFSSVTKANAGPTEIALGSTLSETIDNAVEAINKYQGWGSANFNFSQIQARRDGNTLIIETKAVGDALHLDLSGGGIATPLDVDLNNIPAGVSLTNNGTLNGGVTTGVTTNGVTNKDFIGTIGGFTATYNGTTDTVNLQVTVGDQTYTALNVRTTVTADTTVRLSSTTGGGFFDIELRANSGTGVTSQASANTFANRLDAAFSTLTFYQNRNVSSYSGVSPIVTDGVVTGALLGTSVKMQLTDFSDVKINNITVNAPSGSSPNGSITFTVNGEEFTSASNIGSKLGAFQTYKFVSATDSNRFIEFKTGSEAIQFDTAAKAASFEKALQGAFGVGKGSEALRFQVGATVADTLSISIGGVTAKDLSISSLDVLTAANAAAASTALDAAINIVTSVRAEVGALQSRFEFASANIESSIQNQDAARGVLLDTDIATESTAFAQAQVKLQAGISVLAQANLLPQNLLKLIG